MNDWMKIAIELAQAAALEDEVPVGALLLHEGKIIGQGANERERTSRTVAHAEVVALENYSKLTGQWRVPIGTSLVVTAEPCMMCVGALIWARVDKIFFGCTDPRRAGLLTLLPQIHAGVFDHRFEEVVGGVEESTCSAMMTGFFRSKRDSGLIEKAESRLTSD